jgi:hypothetical protein
MKNPLAFLKGKPKEDFDVNCGICDNVVKSSKIEHRIELFNNKTNEKIGWTLICEDCNTKILKIADKHKPKDD